MRKKKYVVALSPEQQQELEQLVNKGRAPAYQIKHAHILLKVDSGGGGWSDRQAAEAFDCHGGTVANLRRRFVQRGLQGALIRKVQAAPSREPILDGEKQAHLMALACSPPPRGRVRWTLKLLAHKLVELEVVDSISDQTVRRTLKKTRCSRTGVSAGASRRRRMVSS